MPAPISSLWLLRAHGPVHIPAQRDADGGQVQRPVRCQCPNALEGDWLIVADGEQVTFVCRCGRQHPMDATMGLEDVAAIVEAEPVRPHWTTLDDALAELGFTANTPTRRPHTA